MTKRLLSIVVLFLALSTVASAQFSAGILAGMNMSQVDGDYLSGYNKLGFIGGIAINGKVNDKWLVGFEIDYSMKGSKERSNPDNPKPTLFRLRYDYIEFPIKVTRKIRDFDVYAGPTIGVNVVSKRDENSLGWMDTEIRKMEFGFVLGGQYNVGEHLAVGIRHQNSLIRVGDAYPNGLNIWNRAGLYNRVYSIYAVINLGK